MTTSAAVETSNRAIVGMLKEQGFTFFTGVPDSEFRHLVAELEGDGAYVRATREDNAIGLAVGARLAGGRSLVFMESAGVGNAVDALGSLAVAYGIPLVVFVAWAGYEGRDLPHHNPVGRALAPTLDGLGIPFTVFTGFDGAPEVATEKLAWALRASEELMKPVAVLGIPSQLAEGAVS